MMKKMSRVLFVVLFSAAGSAQAATVVEIKSPMDPLITSMVPGDQDMPRVAVLQDSGGSITLDVASADVSLDSNGNVLVNGKMAFKGDNWRIAAIGEYGAKGFGASIEGEYRPTRYLTLHSKIARAAGSALDVGAGVKVEYKPVTVSTEIGAVVEGELKPHLQVEVAVPVTPNIEGYVDVARTDKETKATVGLRYKK
jgi:hypothetical protein